MIPRAAVDATILMCPRCGGSLEESGRWLQCVRCRAPYETRGGIPDLLPWSGGAPGPEWTRWREKLGLLQQWRRETWDGSPRAQGRQRVADEGAERFFSFARLPAGRVLEVGCGSAQLRRHVPQCEYWGLDPLVGTVDPAAGPGVDTAGPAALVRGVGERLPFAADSFAGVFLCETLDHALDPSRVVGEARRVLAEGGVLAILQSVRAGQDRAPLAARLRAAAGRLKARLAGRRLPLEDRRTKMHVLEREGVAALVAGHLAIEQVLSHGCAVMVRAVKRAS